MDMYSMYINVSLSYASKLCVQFLFVVTLITSQHENIISRINNRLFFRRFVKNDIEILFYHGNDTHLLHVSTMPYLIVLLFTFVQYIVCNTVADNITS